MPRPRRVYMRPSEFRDILKDLGLSITDTAKLLGRDIRTVRHWANDRPITDITLALVLRRLETDTPLTIEELRKLAHGH